MSDQPTAATSIENDAVPHPSFAEACATWARIGLLSFGGPTGQIALMHRVIVDEKRWLDEPRFLNALNFCMLLPGPEAMQLVTYAGWRLHGVKGGLAAGLWFVLPGALVVLALAMLYAAYGNLPLVDAVFLGVKAAVLVIVVEALLRISKRALKERWHWWLAAAAFVAIFFLGAPFPLIVLAAAVLGFVLARGSSGAALALPSTTGVARTVAVWLAIWILPLAALGLVLGRGHVLSQIGWFFSKLAVVTFGGAYAVLAYMAQDVVGHYRWLSVGQMMDGLGLAETTPGPLILVTEFVAYLAAFQSAGQGSALLLGIAGAIVALWATFAPCFLWIFAGAPYVEWLNAQPRLKGALSAITAAVVGVILNLAVWFAVHVLFANKVAETVAGPIKLLVPQWAAFDWRVLVMAVVSALLLLVWHKGIASTLAVAAAMGLAAWAFGL